MKSSLIMIATVILLVGCEGHPSERHQKNKCRRMIEVYERNIASYEQCLAMPRCEIKKVDIANHLLTLESLERCKTLLSEDNNESS